MSVTELSVKISNKNMPAEMYTQKKRVKGVLRFRQIYYPNSCIGFGGTGKC